MKNNINLSSIIYSLILILVDFLVLVFSLEIVIYLRTNILQDFLPEFIESSIYKYYWIIFITLIGYWWHLHTSFFPSNLSRRAESSTIS